MTKFQKVLLALLILFILVIFWRVIIMPYQQANDLRECMDTVVKGKDMNLEGLDFLIKYCETRAKYPSF